MQPWPGHRAIARVVGIGPVRRTWRLSVDAHMEPHWGTRCCRARDLHLVMGPAAPGAPVRFHVRIDGQPPGAAHGADTDDAGNGTVAGPRLHQMIRQPGPVIDRTFEITFSDPGAQVYVFTFG